MTWWQWGIVLLSKVADSILYRCGCVLIGAECRSVRIYSDFLGNEKDHQMVHYSHASRTSLCTSGGVRLNYFSPQVTDESF